MRNKWRNIFKRYLGNSCGKNYKNIIIDLVAVSTGLKASLLFDYTCLESEKARDMLRELKECGLLRERLDVVQLGEDIFIADLNKLVHRLKEILETGAFYLVDVTGSLPEPVVVSTQTRSLVVEQFSQAVWLLEEELRHRNTANEHSCISDPLLVRLETGKDWNFPSLFGFFLTYPMIYWYESTDTNHNCLAMVPLNVYTVKLKVLSFLKTVVSQDDWQWLNGEDDLKHTVFSYSAPVALESDYRHCIAKWNSSLLEEASRLDVGNLVELDSQVVVLKQVAL